MTKIIFKDMFVEQLNEQSQKLIEEYTDLRTCKDAELSKEALIRRLKNNGYEEKDLKIEKVITIVGIHPTAIKTYIHYRISTPHFNTSSQPYREDGFPDYVNEHHPKYLNEAGQKLQEALEPHFEETLRKEQEEKEREEKEALKRIEQEKRKKEKENEEIEKQEEYIKTWIKEHGSDRLKNAWALNLPYEKLFVEEWSLKVINPNLISEAEDEEIIEEDLGDTPSEEKIQSIKEAMEQKFSESIPVERSVIEATSDRYESNEGLAIRYKINMRYRTYYKYLFL